MSLYNYLSIAVAMSPKYCCLSDPDFKSFTTAVTPQADIFLATPQFRNVPRTPRESSKKSPVQIEFKIIN